MTDSVPEEMLPLTERRANGRLDAVMEPTRAVVVEVLFRRHYANLLRLAVVMLGSREPAEDAVQDSFVALQRNWRSLRDLAAAEAYLRSAVLNRCRSWLRRQVAQGDGRPFLVVPEQQQSPEDTPV